VKLLKGKKGVIDSVAQLLRTKKKHRCNKTRGARTHFSPGNCASQSPGSLLDGIAVVEVARTRGGKQSVMGQDLPLYKSSIRTCTDTQIYICTHTYVYIYMHIYVHVYTYTCTYMYVCACTHVSYVYTCMYTRVHVQVHVYVYTCVHACVCV
jgi:hypothetical protein